MGKEKLFCFPYAGGSSTLYEGNFQGLQNDFEIISLDYSGHGTKFGLPLYESMEDMVDDMYKEVTGQLSKEEDYYLFGYSLGSIVAYEIAWRLKKDGYHIPKRMFLCSMEAPHKIPESEWIHTLSDEEFQKKMISMGGIDEELLSDPLMMEIFIPIIRRDFELHEMKEDKEWEILDADALIMYSDEDIADDKIRRWDDFVAGTEYICYPGGHFFIYDKIKEVTEEVLKRK